MALHRNRIITHGNGQLMISSPQHGETCDEMASRAVLIAWRFHKLSLQFGVIAGAMTYAGQTPRFCQNNLQKPA